MSRICSLVFRLFQVSKIIFFLFESGKAGAVAELFIKYIGGNIAINTAFS